MIALKFKKLVEHAILPYRATEGAAGLDLTANNADIESGIRIYGTGVSVEIPSGYVGLLFPRSSVYSTGLILANCVGVIDSDYRGEIKLIFRTVLHSGGHLYMPGDRIGQLVILSLPSYTIEEVSELSETARGTGGFGSTDVKKV